MPVSCSCHSRACLGGNPQAPDYGGLRLAVGWTVRYEFFTFFAFVVRDLANDRLFRGGDRPAELPFPAAATRGSIAGFGHNGFSLKADGLGRVRWWGIGQLLLLLEENRRVHGAG